VKYFYTFLFLTLLGICFPVSISAQTSEEGAQIFEGDETILCTRRNVNVNRRGRAVLRNAFRTVLASEGCPRRFIPIAQVSGQGEPGEGHPEQPGGAPGADGNQGPEGPQGPRGEQGANFYDPLPSGVTVRGVVGGGVYHWKLFLDMPREIEYTASFPAPAPEPPEAVLVRTEPYIEQCLSAPCATDFDMMNQDKCPGTHDEPEALPGFLCVYPERVNYVAVTRIQPGRYGFSVTPFTEMSTLMAEEGFTRFIAAWAYTAPE